jgi:hypothetical protein
MIRVPVMSARGTPQRFAVAGVTKAVFGSL